MRTTLIIAILAVMMGTMVPVGAANNQLGEQEVVLLPGQTYELRVGEYSVLLRTTKVRLVNGGRLEEGGQVYSEKFHGAVRFVDCVVRLTSGKKVKGDLEVSEWVQTTSGNLKGMPSEFVRPVSTEGGRWYDLQAMGDEEPLVDGSFWIVFQRLYVNGRYMATFRLEFTPSDVKMFWVPEPTPPPLPATLQATR